MIAHPRWRKILSDLWSNKARSLLVALSIAVGVFAVGVVVTSFFLVRRDMAADFTSANARTARIYTETFDQTLVNRLAKVPGVVAIEGRYDTWLKATAANGRQYPIDVTSIPPLDEIQVDKIIFEAGARDLRNHEIFLERQGAEGMGLKIGDTVDIEMKDGTVRKMKIAGTVHDVNANPFKFNSQTSGYVTPETMEWLGESPLYNNAAFITSGSQTDVLHVRAIANEVAAQIKDSGLEVFSVNINNPGKHPAQSIIDTVLSLMGALAVMAVFLSGFLVVNTISALMSQQIRHIGVMKAIGATMGQMVGMYLVLVLAFGVISLLVALPLGALVSYGFSRWLVGMLNANMGSFNLPPTSLYLQIAIGLAVPVLAALIPIFNGSRLTVRDAISSYGLSSVSRGWFDRLLEAVRGLPRPLLLSLRNTFRRKGRLALTLFTLTLGGAIFIGVFSVRDAFYAELRQNYGYYKSDVNVNFTRAYPLDQLQAAVQDVPGVVASEGWWSDKINVMHADGINSDQVLVYAPPANTRLVEPIMTEGRWLQPGDENSIVVDNHFLKARPDVRLNDVIKVRISKKDYPFRVVGIFRLATGSTIGTAYVNYETLSRYEHVSGQTNSLKVITDRADAARQMEVLNLLETRLKAHNFDASLQTGSDVIAGNRFSIDILIYLLLFMAVLIATVGGLGLMGTMGMNVLERTREIGVMRSIGAVNSSIFQLVVVEGLLIGLISWALSIAVAVPMAHLLDQVLGMQLMTVPLGYVFSTQGMLLWLGLVTLLSAAACVLPARNAVRLTIRDVLAYE